MAELEKVTGKRFGPFEADFSSGELRKHGLKLKISGQPIRILEMLLEKPGQLVTRDQIHEALWPSNTFVDFDHCLNAAINKLREALGDSADSPSYVETVPRRGYRFIGELADAPDSPKSAPISVQRPVGARNLWLWVLLPTLVIVTGLVIAIWWFRSRPYVGLGVVSNAQITNSQGLSVHPALSPDGRQLVYSTDRGQDFELYIRDVTQAGRELQLTKDGQRNVQPAWSPDGQSIAYYSQKRGGIWLVNVLGGSPRQVIGVGSTPAWSWDGQWIAYQSGENMDLAGDSAGVFPPSAIWLVRPDGSGAHQVTFPGKPEGGHGTPAWSPDGKHIVFVSARYGSSDLWALDLERQETFMLSDKASAYFNPAYAPDGASILYGSFLTGDDNAIYQLPVSLRDSTPTGKPVLLLSGSSKLKNLSLARDGSKLLYVSVSIDNNLSSFRLSQGGITSAPVPLRSSVGCRTTLPRFSPDGAYIAFVGCRAGFNGEIWTMKPDGKAVELAAPGLRAGLPSWFNDSRRILYRTESSSLNAVGVIDIQSKRARELARLTQEMAYIRLSPDEKLVLFHHTEKGATNLWTLSLHERKARQLTFDTGFLGFGEWSHNGRFILAQKKIDKSVQLFVLSSQGRVLKQLTTHPGQHFSGVWSQDDSRIFYAALHGGVWNVYSLNIADKLEQQLTHYKSRNAYVRYPDISPRGDQVVYEYAETNGNIWMLTLAKKEK
ncbi:MAG: winged helix-turn-helix domain-containing protein [Terriglobales bacterium]